MRIFSYLILCLSVFSCQESFDQRLERETMEFTRKHCPQRQDDYTCLDSMTYEPSSRTIVFWHTLSNMETAGLSESLFVENDSILRNFLVERLREDTQWQSCKDADVNFRYVYRSKDAQSSLISILLTNKDYK